MARPQPQSPSRFPWARICIVAVTLRPARGRLDRHSKIASTPRERRCSPDGSPDTRRSTWRGSSSPSPFRSTSSSPPSPSGWRAISPCSKGCGCGPETTSIMQAVRLLEDDLRRRLRHGRRLGHRHVLPVRHQLVGVLRQGRAGARPADGLRGADGLLPRGRASSASCCSAASGSARAALLRHADGRRRHADLGLLDPRGELAGCRRPPATPSTRPASSSRTTGGRSSSTRPSPTGSCTWCWPPI